MKSRGERCACPWLAAKAEDIAHCVVNMDAGNIVQAAQSLKGRTHYLHSTKLPPYRNNMFYFKNPFACTYGISCVIWAE